ncbi:unnamed protein product, partial [Symbiodinium necroappetens]
DDVFLVDTQLARLAKKVRAVDKSLAKAGLRLATEKTKIVANKHYSGARQVRVGDSLFTIAGLGESIRVLGVTFALTDDPSEQAKGIIARTHMHVVQPLVFGELQMKIGQHGMHVQCDSYVCGSTTIKWPAGLNASSRFSICSTDTGPEGLSVLGVKFKSAHHFVHFSGAVRSGGGRSKISLALASVTPAASTPPVQKGNSLTPMDPFGQFLHKTVDNGQSREKNTLPNGMSDGPLGVNFHFVSEGVVSLRV